VFKREEASAPPVFLYLRIVFLATEFEEGQIKQNKCFLNNYMCDVKAGKMKNLPSSGCNIQASQ
jgi:hypothetical protein